MMKKKLFVLPVLAALFTACTNDELVVEENKVQQNEQDGAIAFDAYLNRAVTRAGKPGNMTLESSASGDVKLKDEGFGVFAYYTDGGIYSESAIPNFMYNQMVKYEGGWKYSPIKYWPNEFGTSAISMGVDRVTFFAYAPYVTVEPSTGLLTSHYDGTSVEKSTETGITGVTRNGKAGDPYVRYVGAFDPANCVDLCYGVAAEAFSSAVGAGDGANDISAGDPFLNVAKPDVASKLKFNFKHALAQLNVQVDADVDVAVHNEDNTLEGNTRVWVRSITFDGVSQRGYLNLHTGVWYETIDNSKISHASVTVHDGRRDGAEALAQDTYETPIGLNTDLIQSAAYTTATKEVNGLTVYNGITAPTQSGVIEKPKNLFSGSNLLLVVPANEQLRVTIVYDVETADATLPKFLSDGATRGSTVENKITKVITVGGDPLKLESGKKYNISLHLGMTSVKFEANVSDWQDADGAEEYFPANLPTYSAAAASQNKKVSVTLPAIAVSPYQFAVNGFTGNEAVTAGSPVLPITVVSITDGAATDNVANSGGVAIVEATYGDNNTVKNKIADAIVLTGGTSGNKLTVSVTQKAAPLGLKVLEANQKISGDNGIVLESSATVDWTSDLGEVNNTDASSVIVYKNGTTLTYNASPSADGQFKWDGSDHKIVLFTPATAGDVYTITVKAGDAAAETTSFTVKKQDAQLTGITIGASVAVDATLTVSDISTNPSGAASEIGSNITYVSSDPAVAIVDPSTGEVTGKAVGTFKITATVTDTENYHFTTATYTTGDISVTAAP